METDFIEKIKEKHNLNDHTVQIISMILKTLEESTFDEELKYIIENWKYSLIKEKIGDSQPVLILLYNYPSNLSLFTLVDLDFNEIMEKEVKKFPEPNLDIYEFENKEECDFIVNLIFKFMIAWCAFRWQKLNANSIGYVAYIFVNNSAEQFFLTDFKSEDESAFSGFIEYPIFENSIEKSKLTLFEMYERVSLLFSY